MLHHLASNKTSTITSSDYPHSLADSCRPLVPTFKCPRGDASSSLYSPMSDSYESLIFLNIQTFLKNHMNKENLIQVAFRHLLKAIKCSYFMACLLRARFCYYFFFANISIATFSF